MSVIDQFKAKTPEYHYAPSDVRKAFNIKNEWK